MALYFSEDQMIEAATRYPKAISQVAENVVVITAEEDHLLPGRIVGHAVGVAGRGREAGGTALPGGPGPDPRVAQAGAIPPAKEHDPGRAGPVWPCPVPREGSRPRRERRTPRGRCERATARR